MEMKVSQKFIEKYSNKSLEDVKCPLCDAHDDFVLEKVGYPGVPVQNVICKGCGLIRINPRMSQKDYDDFYTQDFFEYLNPYNRPHYVNTIEKTTDQNFKTEAERFIMPFLLPYVKEGGKVFDVGAGFGQLLYLLRREKKIQPFGIEPDPESRKISEEKMGIPLSPDTIEEHFKKSTEKFDFIILEQVFEHLLHPLETLKGLAERITPEGVIYIGVPGMYNYGVAPDRFFELAHTYGYTPATLKLFAEQAGLKIISVRDPMNSCLEVMMALKDSKYPEEKQERMIQGKDWNDTKNRIRNKKRYFELRKKTKIFLSKIAGERTKNKIRDVIDGLLRKKK
jgi:SAM-dependent methyltransferase